MNMKRTLDLYKTNVTAYWRDPHLEEVNLRYMQQQTRSEIVHIACRIGNENCATQVSNRIQRRMLKSNELMF